MNMKQIFNFCATAVFVFTMICSCAENPPKDERELAERRAHQAEYAKLPGWRRCLKENGLWYTLKHVLKKLTGGNK